MPSQTNDRRVAVLGGNRIPFVRSDGAYANASNQDMFTAVGTNERDPVAAEDGDAARIRVSHIPMLPGVLTLE